MPILPAEAEPERLLIPPSTAATLNLAASAAQAARLWRDADPVFADRALAAARRAYAAARRYPDLFAYDSFDGGGAYGDTNVEDEFYWAAAELYLTTGETAFRQDLVGEDADFAASRHDIFWADVDLLPALSLMRHAEVLTEAERAAAREQILAVAERYLQHRDTEGYAFPMSPDAFQWGSTGNIAARGQVLAAAYDLTGEARYRAAVIDAMDFLLGRNALGQSYISGYGERAMRHPHHRFWAQGADPEYPPAPPGAVSGGPNAGNMADPVAREMRGTCVEQTCWVDDYRAYALNEVAINWNAPVFAIALFLESTVLRTATGSAGNP